WKFDDGSGGIAEDSSCRDNIGTLMRGPAWVPGRSGTALAFDGVDDSVNVFDAPGLGPTTALSIAAWIRPAATKTDFRTIVVKNYDYFLYASSTGYCSPTGSIMGGWESAFVCGPVPVLDWTHVALTYDGSLLVLFVNGVPVATAPATTPLTTGGGTLQIG